MAESNAALETYRTWLSRRITDVLTRPAAHAASPAEAEITLLTLMEAYVAAWSIARGRSPDRDVGRVVGLWRAACVRLRGGGTDHARLATHRPLGEGTFTPEDLVRLTDGMSRVWEDVQAMCP